VTTTNFRNERIEEATADLSMERMGAEDDYNEYFGLAQHKLEKLTKK
jgi:hypothetical protein